MAREIISSILTSDYNPDRGGNIPNLGFRFGKPADLSDAVVDAILGLFNARRKTSADSSACPVASDFSPRKLRFIRRDGNSLALTLFNRGNALTVAAGVKAAIDGAAGDNPVQCIELLGEKWDDILPELRTSTGAPTPGTPSRSTIGGKQYQHSGKILYQYDAGGGNISTVAVKVDTDNVTAAGVTSAPTILGAAWASCVGTFEAQSPCSSKDYWSHRRYLSTLLTSADPVDPAVPNVYQTSEVPVRRFDTPDILACGTALANLASIVCLGYKGETNKRLHLLLP